MTITSRSTMIVPASPSLPCELSVRSFAKSSQSLSASHVLIRTNGQTVPDRAFFLPLNASQPWPRSTARPSSTHTFPKRPAASSN
jgi:hypothetical protein